MSLELIQEGESMVEKEFFGEGKNIEQIIHDADQMMYENKRKHHGTR